MERRSFLKSLFTAAAALPVAASGLVELDLEKLLWVPGKVAVFDMGDLPTRGLLTTDVITREALAVLENNLTFSRAVNRTYDAKFGFTGAKIGSTINMRIPHRYYK
jgi:hypothetical protein